MAAHLLRSAASDDDSRITNGLDLGIEERFASSIHQAFQLWTYFQRGVHIQQVNRLCVEQFPGYQYDEPFNLQYQKGLSDFNRTNTFVLSWLWSSKMHFGNRYAGAALNGWTFGAIHSFANGHPFTVYEGTDVALDGTGSRQHAQLLPGANVQGTWTNTAQELNEYFNTAAFVPPSQVPAGAYSDSPRNPPELVTPGLNNTDFSIIRDFKITERFQLQFRSEFFQSIQHAAFQLPGKQLVRRWRL